MFDRPLGSKLENGSVEADAATSWSSLLIEVIMKMLGTVFSRERKEIY